MADTHAQTGPNLGLSGSEVLRSLADNWWLLLLRGIAAIAFGVLAFFWPGLTLVTLTLMWGAYALMDGVIAIWAAFSASGGDARPRWWLGLSGVAGILAGVVTFYYTGTTTLVLLTFIAVWAIIIGVMQIWGAIALRKVLQQEWLLICNGLLSIAFGAILLAQPGTGALALVWVIAWYAIFFGCLYIALAFKLKQYKRA
ncbi:HdeD family acid-resistance protein [Bradyrhizobium uaiense]|uniref:HdeD family acid-resistance protein n=1 Tax=Bradyrhizobium uaiense TaxID=2594946 RepID=A0A6P1BEZ4_9BRAD|nr:HdeD family acid-resistance protein [Bradyrhizobium uaiense]NEU97096.1 HdeD family acid-resistance protein [Bradyrhizobium uaiense]